MAVEGLKKHAGKLDNTGVRVAVVFRKLPNDEQHCLIVETERLPDSYHDYMIQSLNSKEAAETNDFFEVLNRRTFPDGLNCLTALHQRGFLRKEKISNVTMLPLPGQAVPLALINATIDNKLNEYTTGTANAAETTTVKEDLVGNPTEIARGLILQAELLEKDAAAKREEAYALAPELKPGKGRPATPDELKAEKLEDRKNKRRERDQRKAAEAKESKAKSIIDAKVEAKIKRDQARLMNESAEIAE